VSYGSEIRFEAYTEHEILPLPKEQVEPMILTDLGPQTVAGEFRVGGERLQIELAPADGGDGVPLGARSSWPEIRMANALM
jgi:hypothetical protein